MKRNRFFTAEKLPYLLMLLSMMLLVACGGSKKHHSDDEDSDEMDEEEEVADIDEGDDENAALFDLLYDINAKADCYAGSYTGTEWIIPKECRK